jgi:hypothetical protein
MKNHLPVKLKNLFKAINHDDPWLGLKPEEA